MRIEKLSLQVLSHATEDEEKVMKSVENTIGVGNMDKIKISSQTLKGYYNDPIKLIRIEVPDSRIALDMCRNIFSKLSEHEKNEAILGGLEVGKHGGKLYIRLDKQAAYRGMLRLSDKDSIRIEIGVRGDIKKFLKMLGLESMERDDSTRDGLSID